MDIKNCAGVRGDNWTVGVTRTGGHGMEEYSTIGYSPCKRYVSHVSSQKCDVINVPVEIDLEAHECMCGSGKCPCGDFISHKVDEPCTADLIEFHRSWMKKQDIEEA